MAVQLIRASISQGLSMCWHRAMSFISIIKRIPTTTLWGRYEEFPHLTDEKIEAHRVDKFPQDSESVSGRVGIQIQRVWQGATSPSWVRGDGQTLVQGGGRCQTCSQSQCILQPGSQEGMNRAGACGHRRDLRRHTLEGGQVRTREPASGYALGPLVCFPNTPCRVPKNIIICDIWPTLRYLTLGIFFKRSHQKF